MSFPYTNQVRISGKIVSNPELRVTQAGLQVTNLKLVCQKEIENDDGTNRTEACFIDISLWENLAPVGHQLLFRDAEVVIEGELKSRLRKNKDGSRRPVVEIKAEKIEYLDDQGRVGIIDDNTQPAAISSPEPTVSNTVTAEATPDEPVQVQEAEIEPEQPKYSEASTENNNEEHIVLVSEDHDEL